MEMSRLWRRITQNGKDDKQINENLISIQLDQYSLRKRLREIDWNNSNNNNKWTNEKIILMWFDQNSFYKKKFWIKGRNQFNEWILMKI